MGRPSDFTPEIADAICERLADGESLRAICQDDDMPHKATVFRWLAKDKEFRDQYVHAREEQAETLVDEMVAIADKAHPDHVVDDVQDRRLRIETRKWVAGKLKGKYSEKATVDHTSSDGSMTPKPAIDASKLSDSTLAELLNAATNAG